MKKVPIKFMENEPKREVSTLIPYKKVGDTYYFFIQRRDKDAKRLPDWFGLFGGGIEEGESPEDALKREIKEELVFEPKGYEFFNRYEFLTSINNVFILAVDDDFEIKIKVLEGQYGKFCTPSEIQSEPKMIDSDKLIFKQVTMRLNGQL